MTGEINNEDARLFGELAGFGFNGDIDGCKDLIRDLGLALMFLTSREEKSPAGSVRRCLGSFDWDFIDELRDMGLVEGPNKAKSLYLTDEGMGLGSMIAGVCREALRVAHEEAAKLVASMRPVSNERAFRLRVDLDLWEEHPCWRELVVPARFSFADLHGVIQSAFLWWGYHLYDFQLTNHGQRLTITNPDQGGVDSMFAMMFGGSSATAQVNAYDMTLDEVFPRTRTARYNYDYGDGWEHRIKLLETIPCYEGDMPVCVAGEGDASPEDAGGPGGFKDFLRVIADPADPEHDEMVAWGESLFYEPFSLEAVNRRIHAWRTGELFDEWDERNGSQI